MEHNSITNNGINILQDLIAEKKLDNLNLNLQVTNCKIQESSQKKMIRCVLNDSVVKCSAVIIPGEGQDVDNNDLIKVEQIYGSNSTSSNLNKVGGLIVVKRCQILEKNFPIRNDIESLRPYQKPINNKNQNNNAEGVQQNNNNYQANNQMEFKRTEINYNQGGNDLDDRKYMKINSLSSFTKEICIKARVTKKMPMKTFQKQGGKQGSVFGFNIIDDMGEELPVSAFNQVCERFHNIIEENAVYEISGGYIKINDKKYSTIKSEYKLFLDDKTQIKQLQDDGKINRVNFKFIKIGDLPGIEQYSAVDLRAMVVEIGEKTVIRTKKNEERDVRKIQIGDSTGYKVEVSIWGAKSDYNFDTNTVYGFKCLKVNNYKGKSLNLGDESQIMELDDKEAMNEKMECSNLDGNFKPLPVEKMDQGLETIYPVKSIKEIIEMLDATDDEKYKFPLCKVKANIAQVNMNERSYYIGCPDCKKKIAENDSECPFCKKTFAAPTSYYSLNIRLKDHSGDFYCDVLGAIGQRVMGMNCDEFRELINSGDEEKQKSLARQVESQTSWFIVSPKINVYNDIKRKRYSIMRVLEVDAQKNAEYIIDAFMKMPQFQ